VGRGILFDAFIRLRFKILAELVKTRRAVADRRGPNLSDVIHVVGCVDAKDDESSKTSVRCQELRDLVERLPVMGQDLGY
jgi:hypothetical protein